MKNVIIKLLNKIGISRHRLYYAKESIAHLLGKRKTEQGLPVIEYENKTIEIGNRKIELDLSNKHEKEYYDNFIKDIPEVDFLIAKKLIQPNDIVLDAGANIGITGLTYLLCKAKEVHAFEPLPVLHSRLSKLVSKDFFSYPFALSDKNGTASIIVSQMHNQGSTLNKEFTNIHPIVFGKKPVKIDIKTVTLDSMFQDKKFDFIKVDIEGHEIPFLKGANNLFTTKPPRILQIEIYDLLFEETNSILSKFFSSVKRVAYNQQLKKVIFVDVSSNYSEYQSKGFQIQPPNYIYTNDNNYFDNIDIPK